MINRVLTDVSAVTNEWLAAVLQRAGALEHGTITKVDVTAEKTTNSASAHIAIEYSADARGCLPTRLFLKMCSAANSSTGQPFGDSEPLYYTRDYADLRNGPVAETFDVRHSPEQHAYHVLMRDYSETHAPAWDLAPTPTLGARLAEAAATLHAHHAQTRGDVVRSLTSPAHWRRHFDVVNRGVEPLATEIDADPDTSEALFQVTERHSSLLQHRSADPTGQTLIHGDLNPGNILVPIDPNGPMIFIDRQPFDWSLTTWLGVADLARVLVLTWETAHRRALEVGVLDRYHTALTAAGVHYPRTQLDEDYRLAIAQCLHTPIVWCINETERQEMKRLWTQQLDRTMAAYRDHDCAELMD